MVHKALYAQALIISLISSPTSLLLIHFILVTLPHWSSKPVAIFLPRGLWTYYFCQKYSSPDVSQAQSLISFMSLLKVSAPVRTSLLVWDKCPLSYQHSHFYAFFPHCISLHLAYIFYRLLITIKRMLISTKVWVLSVLSDSVPSIPRVLETDVAPNNPLLNKWTLWGVNGIMYNIYCSQQVVGVQEILISILTSAHIDYNICHSINNCIKWHITMETNSQRNLS